jgi:hypothetical protein
VSPQASPVATADGRIYFASVNKSYVIRAGPELEILAVNELPGSYEGPSPAVSGGRIFLRSPASELFCIGATHAEPEKAGPGKK